MKWNHDGKKLLHRFAKPTLGALLVLMPASTTIASASTTSSKVSFEAQYHSNLTTESKLLQTARMVNVSNPQINTVQYDVLTLNNQISQLYYFYLLLTMRLEESNNVRQSPYELTRNIESTLHKVHSKWSSSTSRLYTRLYYQTLATLRSDRADWVDGERDFLARLESTILALQNVSINETKLWITLEEQATSSVYGPLSIHSSASSLGENSTLTYTIQLKDLFGNPVTMSGIKINVSLMPGHNDGSLTATSVFTDNQGRAYVNVLAGNTPGTLQISAQVDGATSPATASEVTQVFDSSTFITHIALGGPAIPSSVLSGQTVGGVADTFLPENGNNQVVSGDTLTVTSSNVNILSPNTPDTAGGNTVTLHAGNYTFPSFTAKASGTATITVRDVTQFNHPSLTFAIKVSQSTPIALSAVNPLGTLASYDVLAGGVVGPFTITVRDSSGNVVSTPHTIQLSSAQVNQLIGTGSGVRLSPSGPDVANVVISPGESSVTVYADNAVVGWTNPVQLALNSIIPYVTNVSVKNSSTIEVDYSQILNANVLPKASDFTVGFGWGSGTPKSVSISGRTLIIHMWGDTFVRSQSVSLTYNSTSDSHPLLTYWGAFVPNFSNLAVSNKL